jgi:mono/diheme cytochrome c family protein
MPSFHKAGGAGGDKPLLSAEQIEDVVAYLSSLKSK